MRIRANTGVDQGPVATGSGRVVLGNLQALRCLAALMVLFGHVQDEVVGLRIGASVFTPFEPVAWGAGVDIFFVISGFIMYHISAERFCAAGAGWEFLKRRAVRLVPIYWIFTTVMLLALIVFSGRINHNEVTSVQVGASYLFLPWPRADGALRPILSLGWTLNYEVMFYVAFAAALVAPRRWGMLALVAVLGALVAAGTFVPSEWWMLHFWTRPIILEFLFGIALAQAARAGIRLTWPVGLGLACLGVAAMVAAKTFDLPLVVWRPIWAGVPALMICAGLALAPNSTNPLLGFLSAGGDVSYSLYLSHAFTVNLLALAWDRFSMGMPWGFVAVSIAASFAVAWASYRLLELPILHWLRSRPDPGGRPAGVAVA